MRTWRGTASDNWNDPANWLEGAAPTAADDAVFDARSPGCVLTAAGECARLVIARDFPGAVDTAGWGLCIGELEDARLEAGQASLAASQEAREIRQGGLKPREVTRG